LLQIKDIQILEWHIWEENFFKTNMEDWVRSGGNPLDLVATIDGGHPSFLHHQLKSKKFGVFLKEDFLMQ